MKKHWRENIENICSDITKIANKIWGLNSNQIRVLNVLIMRDGIFTGKIKSIKANNKGLPEMFEEKSDRKNQKSDE